MAHDMLRVLISNEGGVFVAQCLEHDVCVQGPDLATAQRRFEETLACEMADGHFDTIEPAPQEIQALWDDARTLGGSPENTEMRLAA